jgi:hypothetical protein
LTLLKNASRFTPELVEKLHESRVMPGDIYAAFGRLTFNEWTVERVDSYHADVMSLGDFKEALNLAVDERTAALQAELAEEKASRKRDRDENAMLRGKFARMRAG